MWQRWATWEERWVPRCWLRGDPPFWLRGETGERICKQPVTRDGSRWRCEK